MADCSKCRRGSPCKKPPYPYRGKPLSRPTGHEAHIPASGRPAVSDTAAGSAASAQGGDIASRNEY